MIETLIHTIAEELRTIQSRGTVADYIPELAGVDGQQFGLSVCLADGRQYSAGDASTLFSVQSISKVFTLAIALGRYGHSFWQRVSREPSAQVFNSVQELEARHGIPANPFVNAGALVTTDALLVDASPKDTLAEILHFVRALADEQGIYIDQRVAQSETTTADKNWALAHILRAYGNLNNTNPKKFYDKLAHFLVHKDKILSLSTLNCFHAWQTASSIAS